MFKKLILGFQNLLLKDMLRFLGNLLLDFQLLFLMLQDCLLLSSRTPDVILSLLVFYIFQTTIRIQGHYIHLAEVIITERTSRYRDTVLKNTSNKVVLIFLNLFRTQDRHIEERRRPCRPEEISYQVFSTRDCTKPGGE